MTTPIMTMTHYLFLTREQRYALSISENEIELIGCCTPVWIHNGKHISPVAEEVFAKYRIKHCPEPEQQTVNLMDEGFFIRLSPDMPKHLLDYHDNGEECLNLTHKNIINIENKIAPIVHFLCMQDATVLNSTLVNE